MKITFPWPDRRVFTNAKRGKHWSHYRPAEKAERETGRLLTFSALNGSTHHYLQTLAHIEGTLRMVITFYPPDNRRRDDDGMIGAFKHQRDGMADALRVDDCRFSPEYRFGKPVKHGCVEVQIL